MFLSSQNLVYDHFLFCKTYTTLSKVQVKGFIYRMGFILGFILLYLRREHFCLLALE